MKNWPLLVGGLALIGVVLYVFIGQPGPGGPIDGPPAQPSTTRPEATTSPAEDTNIAEAGMDRVENDEPVALPAAEAMDGFVTALPFTGDAAVVRLRLLDGHDRPAAGAFVRVDLDWSPRNDYLSALGLLDEEAWQTGNRLRPDAEGRLELQVPAEADLSLAMTGPVWGSQDRDLQPLAAGQEVDLGDIHMSPAFLIEGLVHDGEGQPVAQATIALAAAGSRMWGGGFQSNVTSEEDGSYELPSIPAGNYQLTVTAPGFLDYHLKRIELKDEARQTLDIEMSHGHSVEGIVQGRDGRPIAGAKVYLTPMGQDSMYWGDWRPEVPQGEPQAVSDAAGHFRLSGLEEGQTFLIGARAAGFAAAQLEASLPAQDLRLQLEPAFVIDGVLRVKGGAGVAGQVVILKKVNGPDDIKQVAGTTSDESGTFHFEGLAAGSYRVEAQNPPTPCAPVDLNLNRDETALVLTMAAGPSLRVQVVDEEGKGIPHAQVSVGAPGSFDDQLSSLGYTEFESDVVTLDGAYLNDLDFAGSYGNNQQQLETDAQGWATFPVLPMGEIEVGASAVGFLPAHEATTLGTEDVEMSLSLKAGGQLELTLLDGNGAPVENLPVTLKAADSGEELDSVMTDALGRALWQDLKAGSYQVAYRANEADGWWWNQDDSEEQAHDQPVVTLKAGEYKRETLIVRDLALLTAVVYRGGEPATGVGVRLEEVNDQGSSYWYGNQSGKPTDGRGEVELAPVKAGHYRVIVKGGLDVPPFTQEIDLHGGPQRVEIRLNGARVSGALRRADNQPLIGARISLVPYVDELSSEEEQKMRNHTATSWGPDGVEFVNFAEIMTTTGSNERGEFAFRDVPEGRWQVVVRAKGHAPWRSEAIHVQSQGAIDIGDHRLRPTAVVEGKDLNWKPQADQPNHNLGFFNWNNSVQLLRADNNQQVAMAQIKEGGRFRLEDIGAGEYKLRKGQYVSSPFTLQDGEMVLMDIPLETPKEKEQRPAGPLIR